VSTPLPDAILFCSVELGSIETTAEEEEAALDRAVNCFRVIPAEIESDIEENERLLVIKLHDLYAPGGAGGWGPPEMEQWIAGLIGDDTDLDDSHPTRFWVHLRDAVSAICALLESPNFDSGVIDLCGRRAWSAPAVLQELSLLWHRFEVTRDRTTTVTDLARAPAFMQSSPREEVERPALEGLHSRLVAADGGGWHPLTQFRTGLMECLALANDQ
jgi:nucleoside-diphosphate-sugar epimerase